MDAIDWPRDHPAVEAEVDIDVYRETLLSGLQAELLASRDHLTAEGNGPDLREEAARATSTIERFLADLRENRLPLRAPAKHPVTALMVEHAIVLQLTREDHAARWDRAELERELSDVEALAVSDALERLGEKGVVHLDGEHATASMCVRYLDGLGMVSV
jgi:hypothetical protein